MEIKQLIYFVRVAELGGFSKAAASLGLSQPSLSQSIRHLEAQLRHDLLVRNGRGVALTDEGRLLLARAKDIIEHVRRTENEVRDLNRSPSGTVRLGCSHAVGVESLGRIVSLFRSRFDRASLEIIKIKGWTAYEWLTSGRLDIGILYDPPINSAIESRPIRDVPIFLVSNKRSTTVPAHNIVSIVDLAEFPLIMPGNTQNAINNLLQRNAAIAGVKISPVMQVEDAAFMLGLVDREMGYTVLPRHSVLQSLVADRMQLNELVGPDYKLKLSLVLSKEHPPTDLIRHTADLVMDVLRDEHLDSVTPPTC